MNILKIIWRVETTSQNMSFEYGDRSNIKFLEIEYIFEVRF